MLIQEELIESKLKEDVEHDYLYYSASIEGLKSILNSTQTEPQENP
jgi:hypothetical protein